MRARAGNETVSVNQFIYWSCIKHPKISITDVAKKRFITLISFNIPNSENYAGMFPNLDIENLLKDERDAPKGI